jgi:hypothetical protein
MDGGWWLLTTTVEAAAAGGYFLYLHLFLLHSFKSSSPQQYFGYLPYLLPPLNGILDIYHRFFIYLHHDKQHLWPHHLLTNKEIHSFRPFCVGGG